VEDFVPDNFVLYTNDANIVQAFGRIGCRCRSFPIIYAGACATIIRRKMAFEPEEEWSKLVDPEVADYLKKIAGPERIRRLM